MSKTFSSLMLASLLLPFALTTACDHPDVEDTDTRIATLEADLAARDAEIVDLVAEVDGLESALAARAAVMPLQPPPGVDLTPRELAPGEVSKREQGKPAGIYITAFAGNQIVREVVAKMVLSPGEKYKDPAETCTLSWYQPDTSKNEMVLGLGCSMLAPLELWQFYLGLFDQPANNPVKF